MPCPAVKCQNTLEVSPLAVWLDQQRMRPTGGGPICNSSVCKSSMSSSGQSPHCARNQLVWVILVTPVWEGQPWYQTLLQMLFNFPMQLFQLDSGEVELGSTALVGRVAHLQENFACATLQAKLKSSFSHCGETRHFAYMHDSHFTSSLNVSKLAIFILCNKVDDVDIGKHSLVARLLKGALTYKSPTSLIFKHLVCPNSAKCWCPILTL